MKAAEPGQLTRAALLREAKKVSDQTRAQADDLGRFVDDLRESRQDAGLDARGRLLSDMRLFNGMLRVANEMAERRRQHVPETEGEATPAWALEHEALARAEQSVLESAIAFMRWRVRQA